MDISREHLLIGLLSIGLCYTYIPVGTWLRLQAYRKAGAALPHHKFPLMALFLISGLASVVGLIWLLMHPEIRSWTLPREWIIGGAVAFGILLIGAALHLGAWKRAFQNPEALDPASRDAIIETEQMMSGHPTLKQRARVFFIFVAFLAAIFAVYGYENTVNARPDSDSDSASVTQDSQWGDR